MDNILHSDEKLRSSVVSDIFYPGQKDIVLSLMESYGLTEGHGASAQLILAPHASWDISGMLAARAFNAAAGRDIEQVVMLGPVHNSREEGIFLSDSDYFETPLGLIKTDKELGEELESCSTSIAFHDIPHLHEHALEVLLPFVSFCFPQATIVPILAGGYRASLSVALAHALELVFADRMESTLFVVSSNFTENTGNKEIIGQGNCMLDHILNKDPDAIFKGMKNSTIQACGAVVCAAALSCRLFDDSTVRVIAKQESGSESTSVQYAAICFE